MSTDHPAALALKNELRAVFGSVPFPWRGLRGSAALDDYVTMEEAHEITAREDIHGEWWEIPQDELHRHELGMLYLDAAGVLFYLPAYLNLAIDDVGKKRLWGIDLIASCLDHDCPELRAYQLARLGGLTDAHRRVCVRILEFLRQGLVGVPTRDDELRRVESILVDPYWRQHDRG